jgi:PAS domain S-box-containing protein
METGNAAACQHDHLVLFYESDDFLVDGVCAFLVPALRNGDAAIVAATAAHRVAFEAALLRAGVDVDAATREGRYAAFDAADLLSHLMVDGAPDAKRFEETIGSVVDYVSHEHREVRVYGELAAPLCDREDSDSAVVLEELWNDLAMTRDFELLCAYPMRSFDDDVGAAAFKRICERYTSVILGESSRAIARLRQGPTSPTHDREMLRRSESVINAAGDGIFGINAQGRITIANPAAADMIGYAVDELTGRDLHDLVQHTRPDGGPYPVHESPTHAALDDGAIHRCDTDVYWRKDASSFAVEYTATPIVQDGRTSGAVVIFRDITDRREAERVKDQFTASVSHELRTPLTSIRASLGLLESGALGPLPERGRRMVQIAVKNTDRLVRLINDILDLARIESGSVRLHRVPCDTAELTASAIDAVRPMATQAGVTLLAETRHAIFVADADRLVQTLTNLIANSVKFSPAGSSVRITAKLRDRDVLFEVIDRGRGIPADKLETIFERFEQVDAADARQRCGTGLGLAICRSIVERHDGRIWARSTLGLGSTVAFVIPATRDHDLGSRPATRPAPAPSMPACERAPLVA